MLSAPTPGGEKRTKKKVLVLVKWVAISLIGALTIICASIVGLLIFGTLYSEPMQMYPERAQAIEFTPPTSLIPGREFPDDVQLMRSTNNVDLIRIGETLFLAFRTAPTHFASSKTKIYILRSEDEGKTWQKELCLGLGCDLREPRFLYFHDKLFLYFFTGGVNPFRFEPNYIHFVERVEQAKWTDPKPIYQPGYVVWRVRPRGDKAYMSVYYGTELYTRGDRGEVRLLVSTDGIQWEPISKEPQLTVAGAEEAEFVFDETGGIVAIVRLEKTGGGLICRAPAENISCWECKFTPYKVDSSLLLPYQKKFYLVGRRNIAGVSARKIPLFPERISHLWSMVFYSLTRKRTCLYEINPTTLELYPLLDFPSKGDTAFAGIAPISSNKYLLVNYSSPLHGPDLPWILGQIYGSQLYSFFIELPD